MSRKVAQNALWNVGGQLVTMGVGLAALPILLHLLGAARLGVFTLALGLIGFSGLFDMGLSRALTQTVSSSLGQGRSRSQVAALVWRVMGLLAASGVLWLVALWSASPFLVNRLFSLSGEMARETLFGLRALALSIPFALVATGALGTLEGLQQFRLLSLWRMPMSVLQFGLPVIAALMRPDIGWAIAALAATRVVWMILWLAQLQRLLPLKPWITANNDDLRHALHFGGWLSVSNLIGPLMVYADRFYLASVFPPASVAYYTVPLDGVSRMSNLASMAMGAVFPALAESQTDPSRAKQLLQYSNRALVSLMLPPLLLATIFAMPLLALWLDATFAKHAARVLQWLILGIFLNGNAHLPYALLQAHGRSDLTAKLHVLELLLFAVFLVFGVTRWGLEGAAVAWTLRVAVDTGLLYMSAWKLLPRLRTVLQHSVLLILSAAVTLCVPLTTIRLGLLGSLALCVWILCGISALDLLRQWRLNQPLRCHL
jgi:O-antigen/teichoic acid export membrane protein